MTERLDDIVGEMREWDYDDGNPDSCVVNGWAIRLSAAAALERAEHRRQLDEALAPMTDAEEDAIDDKLPDNDNCPASWVRELLASRRARMVKEG